MNCSNFCSDISGNHAKNFFAQAEKVCDLLDNEAWKAEFLTAMKGVFTILAVSADYDFSLKTASTSNYTVCSMH